MKKTFVFKRIPQGRLPSLLIQRNIWVAYCYGEPSIDSPTTGGRVTDFSRTIKLSDEISLTFWFLAPPGIVLPDSLICRCQAVAEDLVGYIDDDDPEFTVTG